MLLTLSCIFPRMNVVDGNIMGAEHGCLFHETFILQTIQIKATHGPKSLCSNLLDTFAWPQHSRLTGTNMELLQPLVFHIAWPSSPWVAVVVGALGCKPLDNPLVRGPWACNMKQNKSSEASSRYQSHWLMLWHAMTSNNGHACVIPLYLEPWTNFKRLPPFQCCWCRCRAWWPCEQCAYAIHCNTM